MGSGEPRPERVPAKAHFTGHRQGARRLCVMPVELTGTSGKFQGRTIDLSRSGALIEITTHQAALCRLPVGSSILVEVPLAEGRDILQRCLRSRATVVRIEQCDVPVVRFAVRFGHLQFATWQGDCLMEPQFLASRLI